MATYNPKSLKAEEFINDEEILTTIEYAEQNDVKLIIVLDCGIKAIEEIAYAKQRGIDFIICDHHVPDEEIPEAVAILNPKMPGSTYPCPHLSGCDLSLCKHLRLAMD